MTADLVAFLRERLDEDEQAARIISPGGFAPEVWRAEPVRSGRWMQIVPYERTTDEPPGSEQRASDSPTVLVANNRAEWGHITRHDPARVLAEVDAKRRILDLWREEPKAAELGWDVGWWNAVDEVLQLLALPYAAHHDYRPDWAPSPTA